MVDRHESTLEFGKLSRVQTLKMRIRIQIEGQSQGQGQAGIDAKASKQAHIESKERRRAAG